MTESKPIEESRSSSFNISRELGIEYTYYIKNEEIQEINRNIDPEDLTQLKKCPRCSKKYSTYPAHSRWTHRRNIYLCPKCGQEEGFFDLFIYNSLHEIKEKVNHREISYNTENLQKEYLKTEIRIERSWLDQLLGIYKSFPVNLSDFDMDHKYTITDRGHNSVDHLFITPTKRQGFFNFSLFNLKNRRTLDPDNSLNIKWLIPFLKTSSLDLENLNISKTKIQHKPKYSYISQAGTLQEKKTVEETIPKDIDKFKNWNDKDFVYFLQAAKGGNIKIGYSKNPKKRIKQIQNYSPSKLKLLCFIKGGQKREHYLHKKFSEFRVHGEWFIPSQELLDFIQRKKEVIDD